MRCLLCMIYFSFLLERLVVFGLIILVPTVKKCTRHPYDLDTPLVNEEISTILVAYFGLIDIGLSTQRSHCSFMMTEKPTSNRKWTNAGRFD